jgi:hypothetical protein
MIITKYITELKDGKSELEQYANNVLGSIYPQTLISIDNNIMLCIIKLSY